LTVSGMSRWCVVVFWGAACVLPYWGQETWTIDTSKKRVSLGVSLGKLSSVVSPGDDIEIHGFLGEVGDLPPAENFAGIDIVWVMPEVSRLVAVESTPRSPSGSVGLRLSLDKAPQGEAEVSILVDGHSVGQWQARRSSPKAFLVEGSNLPLDASSLEVSWRDSGFWSRQSVALREEGAVCLSGAWPWEGEHPPFIHGGGQAPDLHIEVLSHGVRDRVRGVSQFLLGDQASDWARVEPSYQVFLPPRAERPWVFLLDGSGSMAEGVYQEALKVLQEWSDGVAGPLHVWVFHDQLEGPFHVQSGILPEALWNWLPHGPTRLGDALDELLLQAGSSEVLWILGDGQDLVPPSGGWASLISKLNQRFRRRIWIQSGDQSVKESLPENLTHDLVASQADFRVAMEGILDRHTSAQVESMVALEGGAFDLPQKIALGAVHPPLSLHPEATPLMVDDQGQVRLAYRANSEGFVFGALMSDLNAAAPLISTLAIELARPSIRRVGDWLLASSKPSGPWFSSRRSLAFEPRGDGSWRAGPLNSEMPVLDGQGNVMFPSSGSEETLFRDWLRRVPYGPIDRSPTVGWLLWGLGAALLSVGLRQRR